VHESPALFRLRRELRNRLNRPDLVVDPHRGADSHRIVDELVERRKIDHAIGGHREHALFGAFPRRLVHGPKYRLVLDRRRHDRSASLRLECSPRAEDGEVVAFSPARGEADLVRPRS
jgi:hypothetical protein